MAVFSGPEIVNNGLMVCLDSSNDKITYPTNTNILYNKIWSIGTGTNQFYSRNGSVEENERIYDTDPFGRTDIIWQSPSNDIESNDDGGWNTNRFIIDKTKKYRYSVWIRKKDIIGNGRAYLGVYGFDSSATNIGTYNRSNNSVLNTNFYFTSRTFNGNELVPAASVNEWVLFVGHVHPAGSNSGSNESESGVWKKDGTKIAAAGDCIWHANTVFANHRSYQYYSTSTTEKQQWWDPRVDLVDGTQPTLNDLLNGIQDPNQKDLTLSRKIRCPQGIRSSSNGYVFSSNIRYDESQNISIDASEINISNEQTVILVLKPTNFSQRMNPYDQEYYGHGSITQETDKSYTYFYGTGVSSTYSSFSSNFIVDQSETAFIAFVRDSTTIKSYKNGELKSTGSSAYNSTTNSQINNIIKLGIGYTGYGFIGSIYCFMLYNRALSAAEIRQNFEALRSRFNL